ncbi:hypothetical protein [Clostridium magnum]|uniref:PIR Superfamily Protein n=1 Tax=Clostridium magnum DSM 2767 TaxID=1121326 RepID=A0A162U9N1_9CLOT|nr:hypothetical protein [Clostridium magnum]KZL93675.1 hypothetical protein CLMAG_07260 [Clostridium magnum DSM 2767]SHI92670.1 hypothetical protein SAMN02745944_05069 [Clostridium magnum DSM 2767]
MKDKIKKLIQDGIKLKEKYKNNYSDVSNYKKEFLNWINEYKHLIEYIEGKDCIRYKNFCLWINSIENISCELLDVLIGFLKGMETSIED